MQVELLRSYEFHQFEGYYATINAYVTIADNPAQHKGKFSLLLTTSLSHVDLVNTK